MDDDIRRAILAELTASGRNPGHAREILASLEAAAIRYESDVRLRREARASRPPRRGRPADVCERQFEVRVVQALLDNGVPVPDYEDSPATRIMSLMRSSLGRAVDTRSVVRRALSRLQTLTLLAEKPELLSKGPERTETRLKHRRMGRRG